MQRRLLCLLAASLLGPGFARADPPAPKSRVQEARSYVDAGLAAQRSHDYDTAILLYRKAYELVPHPVLLFDMAQAHRLAGRVEQALALYRKYLRAAPNGREAATARELIAELEANRPVPDRADTAGSDAAAADLSSAETDDPPAPTTAPARRVAERSSAPGAAERTSAPGAAERTSAPGAAERSSAPSAAERDAVAGAASAPAGEPRSRTLAPPGASPVITAETEAPGPAHRAPPGLSLATLHLGMALAQRQLDYDVRQGYLGPQPSQLAVSGGALRIEGEIYPFALSAPDHPLARLGLAAMYEKTLGVSLETLDTTSGSGVASAGVDASRLRIGARLRFIVGDAATIALGIDYARRRYFLVDRSSPDAFDVPDVEYASIDPSIALEAPAGRSVTVFARAAGMLMFDAGPISDSMSFGRSTVFGVEAATGLDVALSPHVALRLALEYSRIGLSFDLSNPQTAGRDGDPSTKDINGATDQSLGGAATIRIAY